ncbi:phage tail-like protein [Jatrophihabitans sp. GAS493]|uniref:phage tail protein n=1 Tax=Jatrophihabitans sp. GAS493 TaxID=1907575 RepID=UPI000BB7D9C4|nr:phage tail protein [Jatrophihabitans sp. GAS493]SOD70952.1 phage tail-like protein [Jatrophihabitans sp. GAS493]
MSQPVVSVPSASGKAVDGRPGIRLSRRSPQWMLNQLPVGMLGSDFFVRFVSLFQDLGTGLLEDADNIDYLADVSVAPDAMVRWLGSWIGMNSLDPSLPDDLQRRIVDGSAQTLAWRGTVTGLRRFLELTTGGPAEVVDGGGVWREGDAPTDTAWVRMSVDSTGWLLEADFVELVRDEIPAHVRAELWVQDRRVWSSGGEVASQLEAASATSSSRALPIAPTPDEEQTGPDGQSARPQENP